MHVKPELIWLHTAFYEESGKNSRFFPNPSDPPALN